MPKLEISIDTNYRRIERGASEIRTALREHVHPPARRATTRTLFVIGVAATMIGGALLLWFG